MKVEDTNVKLNLPNKLTVLRLILVPVFMVVMYFNALWADILGLLLFIGASVTDLLDGKIARKHGLVTDFGKFLDPLADKFMVLGAMMMILLKSFTRESTGLLFSVVFFFAVLIVIFRELAVTSMRLVVSGSSGIVIAANMLGKIKTCTQITCVIACIVEPAFYGLLAPLELSVITVLSKYLPLSLLTTAVRAFFTLWSGINYILAYWKYLDPEK